MSTNYSLLFYLKKPKNYVGGMKPIYMRITVAGDPKEVSTGRECNPVRWNAKANRAKGTKEDIRGLNAYLDTLERKVADAHLQLVKGRHGNHRRIAETEIPRQGRETAVFDGNVYRTQPEDGSVAWERFQTQHAERLQHFCCTPDLLSGKMPW